MSEIKTRLPDWVLQGLTGTPQQRLEMIEKMFLGSREAYRAGQEDMRRRAVEITVPFQVNLDDPRRAQDQLAAHIASLEVRDD